MKRKSKIFLLIALSILIFIFCFEISALFEEINSYATTIKLYSDEMEQYRGSPFYKDIYETRLPMIERLETLMFRTVLSILKIVILIAICLFGIFRISPIPKYKQIFLSHIKNRKVKKFEKLKKQIEEIEKDA
jgi:hypothetical protein